MATLDQVFDQMYAAGMPPLPDGQLHVDGAVHRYGRKRKAWYRLREFPGRGGVRFIVGAFGIWGELESTKVRSDFAGMDPAERERLQQSLAAAREAERAKRERIARFAANRARQQWDAARAQLGKDQACPYLERKGVAPANGLRFMPDGTLLVPMVRYDVTEEQEQDPAYTGARRLVGLQKIAPDGDKRFNKGVQMAGAAFRIGKKPKDGRLIAIGEGLATILSAHQAMEGDLTSFVAFFADNLMHVAKIVRALYPNSPILFLADDDAYIEGQLNKKLRDNFEAEGLFRVEHRIGDMMVLPVKGGATINVRGEIQTDDWGTDALIGAIERDGKVLRTFACSNAGRTHAWAAAQAIGNAFVCWPQFVDRPLSPDPDAKHFTDFNDLHAIEGMGQVRLQIVAAMEIANAGRDSNVIDFPGGAKSISTPKNKASPNEGGKGGSGGGGADDFDIEMHDSLLSRFTQIYPSDSAFDGMLGRVVKIPHMKYMFGPGSVARWLASKKKRYIDSENVVFDPTQSNDPQTTVNLFRGLTFKPSETASCERLLDLLHYLCGENREDTETPITTWVLRWCAYQVQHVGAKMRTAIVMHGPEGTGKNQFWNAFRTIFGRYGGLITQSELEDKHNTWLSAKLFLIANEVVTRQEFSHHVGRLKNLITEDDIYINPKNVDQRYERNHVNLVFNSNELRPLQISADDRRFMIIKTPVKKDRDYYKAIGAEVHAGGAAALFHYLLQYDLADFDEHTKPPLTAAKETLIEVNMPTPQLFWQELHEGVLGIDYGPAQVIDVYRLYTIWCARNGFKVPQAINVFTPSFMSMNGVSRRQMRIPKIEPALEFVADEEAAKDKIKTAQRKVFLMGTPESDRDAERRRIAVGVERFKNQLRQYAREDASYSPKPQFGDREGVL